MAEQNKLQTVLTEAKQIYMPEQHKDFIVDHFAGADQLVNITAHNVADQISDEELNSKLELDSAIANELDKLRNDPKRV